MTRSFSRVDALEPRRLLASTVLSIDGILTITGDNTADTITVGLNANGQQVQVMLNGDPRLFTKTSVKQIRASLLGGNDSLTVLTANGTLGVKLIVNGGDGKDTITGGPENDDFRGDAGDDRIDGGFGKNVIRGGTGNDKLVGGNNRDIIYGDDGDDNIFGKFGRNVLRGGAGNDTIRGGDDNDTIDGGAGNDSIVGNAGSDQLVGRDGNDTILGGAGADVLWGVLGVDDLQGGDGNDTLWGGDGNDVLDGGAGSNKVHQGEDAEITQVLATIDAITS